PPERFQCPLISDKLDGIIVVSLSIEYQICYLCGVVTRCAELRNPRSRKSISKRCRDKRWSASIY
ncbi:hypothetical protein ABUE31_22655, partial [Mesorhizobium sp. ZMM04-5]